MSFLKFIFSVFCISLSMLTTAFEDPLKPLTEILKSTGIAQEKLKYTNDFPYLIRNGNKWEFLISLMLKYGYNPFEEKPFKTLNSLNTAQAEKDFALYYKTTEIIEEQLIHEKAEKKSYNPTMIKSGSVQLFGSGLAFLFSRFIPNPLYPVALVGIVYLGITGAKNIYHGLSYQNYLAKRLETNKAIKKNIKQATIQLNRSNSIIHKK